MKWLLCIWLILFSVHAGADKNTSAIQAWVVEKNSSLSIDGSSNINAFICDIKQYIKQDTLIFLLEEKQKRLIFHRRAMTVDVSQFDCHHNFITADLRKTLKFQQYPLMKIHFISMDDPVSVKAGETIKGILDIELAGVARRMDFTYLVKNNSGQLIHLTGVQQMKFSDFKLIPPKKMAGLIKINEDIKVNIQLYFKKIG